MTRQETVQILTLLAGNYESFAKRTQTDEQVEIMVHTWVECLGDLDYNIVLHAVKKTIIESEYPPTIHEVRKNAIELLNPSDKRTPIDAWNEAVKMISNGIYMTQEQFDQASPEVKRFFGTVRGVREIAQIDSDTVNSVIKGQFLKQYDIITQQQQERKLLPQEMQNMIGQLANKMDVNNILGEGN